MFIEHGDHPHIAIRDFVMPQKNARRVESTWLIALYPTDKQEGGTFVGFFLDELKIKRGNLTSHSQAQTHKNQAKKSQNVTFVLKMCEKAKHYSK